MDRCREFFHSPLRGAFSLFPARHGRRGFTGGVIRCDRDVVAKMMANSRVGRDYSPVPGCAVLDFASFCAFPSKICIRADAASAFAGSEVFGWLRCQRIAAQFEQAMRNARQPPSDEEMALDRVRFLNEPDLDGMLRAALDGPVPLWVWLFTRCNHCKGCLERRAWEWQQRATREWLFMGMSHSARITHRKGASCGAWLFTGTFDQQQHALSRAVAICGLRQEGVNFDALEHRLQLDARDKYFYTPRLQKFIKRARKFSSFRMMRVRELHRSGEPHYHYLMLETDPARPVRKDVLYHAWDYDGGGLVRDARLCLPKGSGDAADVVKRTTEYVTKRVTSYVTKSPGIRIRASLNFGRPDLFYAREIAAGRYKPGAVVTLPDASGLLDAAALQAPGGAVSEMSAVDLRSDQEPRERPGDAPLEGADALQLGSERTGMGGPGP